MSKDMTHTASASTATATAPALIRQAPALIRFLSAAQAAPVEPAAHRDRSRSRSVLLGLAVGNILADYINTRYRRSSASVDLIIRYSMPLATAIC